jgi:hypothetical protein
MMNSRFSISCLCRLYILIANLRLFSNGMFISNTKVRKNLCGVKGNQLAIFK